MAKRKSKPVVIVFSIILAVAFIVLSLFTFGQFNLKRARVYSGIFSLVEIGSDINDTVVVSYALAEEEGDVDRASIEKSVEVIRNRLNIPEFATSTVKATDNGFIVELPNSENTSFALNYFFGQGKMSFKTTTNEYLTEKDVTGATVQEAYEQDGINVTASGYSIAIHFTKHGQAQFYEATKEVYEDNGSITIEMDGNTLSQASVNEKINSSSVQISGNYTKEQAQIIASAINNGVLANSFEKQGTEKQASSILGEKAGLKIVLGLLAILVVVAVLFVIFYKGLGVVADLVLLVSVELFALVFALISALIAVSS